MWGPLSYMNLYFTAWALCLFFAGCVGRVAWTWQNDPFHCLMWIRVAVCFWVASSLVLIPGSDGSVFMSMVAFLQLWLGAMLLRQINFH